MTVVASTPFDRDCACCSSINDVDAQVKILEKEVQLEKLRTQSLKETGGLTLCECIDSLGTDQKIDCNPAKTPLCTHYNLYTQH